MTPIDMERLVRTALHEVAPDADVTRLAADASLRDALGLDSLDFLQLVELLSARTGERIEEDDYPRIATLAGTVAFLAERTASRPAGARE